MEEQNPYRSPDAVVADLVVADDNLAGRGERFGAALIDGLIVLAILMPLMYLGGYFRMVMAAKATGGSPGIGITLLWSLIGFVVFVVVQGFPLSVSGQTWGKKMLGIKIVDLAGNQPPLSRLLFVRNLPIQVCANIPIIGQFIPLVEVLLIFRDDRRCGHDLIAGTKVVRA